MPQSDSARACAGGPRGRTRRLCSGRPGKTTRTSVLPIVLRRRTRRDLEALLAGHARSVRNGGQSAGLPGAGARIPRCGSHRARRDDRRQRRVDDVPAHRALREHQSARARRVGVRSRVDRDRLSHLGERGRGAECPPRVRNKDAAAAAVQRGMVRFLGRTNRGGELPRRDDGPASGSPTTSL